MRITFYKGALIAFLFLAAPFACRAALSDNLQLYFTYDVANVSGASVTDLTGGGHTGTIVGTPTFAAGPGNVGRAIGLSGSANYMTTTYNAADTDFSACAWYKQTGSLVSFPRVLDRNYINGFWVGESATSGSFGGGVKESTSPYGIYIAGTHADSTWHFICSVRSGTTHTIYRDTSSTSNTVSGAALSTTYSLIVGNDDSHTVNFNGYITGVGYWNRALSSAEVSQLYNGGSGLAYPFTVTIAPRRKMLLFEGFRIKLVSDTIKLYQQ